MPEHKKPRLEEEMAEELKACPFCGGEAFRNWITEPKFRFTGFSFEIKCRTCTCRVSHRDSPIIATELWNTRQLERIDEGELNDVLMMIDPKKICPDDTTYHFGVITDAISSRFGTSRQDIEKAKADQRRECAEKENLGYEWF